MDKFDIKKLEKQLKNTAKETNIKADSAIFLILNNAKLYNDLVDEYNAGNTAKGYTIYQISIAIFKYLQAFNQVPARQKHTENNTDNTLLDVIAKVNNCK